MSDFAALMRFYRERRKRSRNNLAKEVGVDASYLTRIEHGDRDAPRIAIVESICRALKLDELETSRMYVAAGYSPIVVQELGDWPDTLQVVAHVLGNDALSFEERVQYAEIIYVISHRWLGRKGVIYHRALRALEPMPEPILIHRSNGVPKTHVGGQNQDGVRLRESHDQDC